MTKEQRESLIFGMFAQVAGLMPHGSFTNRKPPEPDILYVDTIGAQSAFEFVEIIDRDYSSSIRRQLGTKDLCNSYLASLPSDCQEAFRSKYANADIFFDFHVNLSMLRRKNALPELFDLLMYLPEGFIGDISEDSLLPTVRRISVLRGRFVGPMFDATSAVWVADPTIESIRGKLSKTYAPHGTLKLLAFIDGNPMFPEEIWLTELDGFLKSLDETCQFKEIFVYDCNTKSLKRHWQQI